MLGPKIALLLTCWVTAAVGSDSDFNGRWVIQPLGDNNGRVLWLEISGASSGEIRGAMVGAGPGGQMDQIREARVQNGQIRFHLERTLRRGSGPSVRTDVTAALHGDHLVGVVHRRSRPLLWVGERAPVLTEQDDGNWREGRPVALFGGSDLEGWRTLRKGDQEGWYVEGGVLKNSRHADVLVSDARFWNFRLQVDFRVHEGMNGGIGLRGRYEIQILDDHGRPASDHGNGALYGRVQPTVNASRRAGEWQELDLRLVGRQLTVTLNGTRTIDRATVDGFTAMASDWREGEPGPITLQGDHGAVEFRSIRVTPLLK